MRGGILGHLRSKGTRFRTAALLLGWLIVSPAFGASITFSTALPVTQGEGIFRFQAKSLSSAGDPTAMDRELNVLAFPLVGVYGATQKLALFGVVPTLDKSLDVTTPLSRRTREVSGLGDVTLLARYTAYKRDRVGRTFRVAPFAGIEIPSGKDDETDELGQLPQPLQLGSGSWDPSIGSIATWQTLGWQIDTSASYKFNTAANGFEFGDVARFDFSYQRRLRPRELGEGVPNFLYGVLESNLIWQDRNEAGGIQDPNSGGVTWFLAPGLQWVSKRLVVEGAVQIPVVQNLHGGALENDYIATLSTRVNF